MADSIELVTVKVEEDGATRVVSNGFVDARGTYSSTNSAANSENESSVTSNNDSNDDLELPSAHSLSTSLSASLSTISSNTSLQDLSINTSTEVPELTHKQKYGTRMVFECKLCNYTTRRSFNFKRHTVLNHSADKSQVERYSCPQCSRKFYNRDHLTNHLKRHDPSSGQFPCTTCGRRLNTLKQLANHRKQHSKQLPTCAICCERFMTDDALLEHQIRRHPGVHGPSAEIDDAASNDGVITIAPNMPKDTDNNETTVEVTTDVPETIEISASTLQPCTPMQAAMVEMEAAGVEESPISTSLGFTCDICQVITNTQQELVTHKLLHMAGNSNICPICKKVFSSVTNMKYHMATHTGEKRYKCAYCPRKFNWRSQLITHEHIHTGKGLYYCPLCGKPCMTKWLLTRHIEVHARGSDTVQESYERSQQKKKSKGGADSSSSTTEQDTTSYSNSTYSDHDSYCSNPLVIDSGNEDSERGSPDLRNPDEPYKCADCGAEYDGKEEMAQHLLTHLIGNKHTCKKCNKEFRKLAMLRRHLNSSPECAKLEGDADNFLEPFQAIPPVAYERLQKQKCVVASMRHTMVSEMFKVGGAEFGMPGFPTGQIIGLTNLSQQLGTPEAVINGTMEEGEIRFTESASPSAAASTPGGSPSSPSSGVTPTLQGLLNAPVRLHTPSDQSPAERQASPPAGNAPPNLPSPPDIKSDSTPPKPEPSATQTLMITPNGLVPLSLIANLHELELGRVQVKSEDVSDDEMDVSKSTQNTTQTTASPDVSVKATKNRRFVSTPRKRPHPPDEEEDPDESPVAPSPKALQIANFESLAPSSESPSVSQTSVSVAAAAAAAATKATNSPVTVLPTLGTISTVTTDASKVCSIIPVDGASPAGPNTSTDVTTEQKHDDITEGSGIAKLMEKQYQQLVVQLRVQHQQQLAQLDCHAAQLQKQMELVRQQSAEQTHRVHQRITALEGILSKQQLVINRLLTHVQVTLPDSLAPVNNNVEKPANGLTASS